MFRAFTLRRVAALPRTAVPRFAPLRAQRLISNQEYHEVADRTLESIVVSYEDLIEKVPDIDVDLAQGVLTLVMPDAGTYVINKQPPNLQIWLSSPISGPKRYDWIDGKWEYSRDHSTLGALLKEETLETQNQTLDLDVE